MNFVCAVQLIRNGARMRDQKKKTLNGRRACLFKGCRSVRSDNSFWQRVQKCQCQHLEVGGPCLMCKRLANEIVSGVQKKNGQV